MRMTIALHIRRTRAEFSLEFYRCQVAGLYFIHAVHVSATATGLYLPYVMLTSVIPGHIKYKTNYDYTRTAKSIL